MKIVALLTARDEAPFLPHYLASVGAIAEEIVGLDDRSTDGTAGLLSAAGVHLLPKDLHSDADLLTFGGRRAALLDEGRRIGGTHFICLDADEVFLGDPARVRAAIGTLQPGQVLTLKQVNFWRGIDRYRDDWAYRRPLGCVFADDRDRSYDVAQIHEDRVPEPPGTIRIHVEPGKLAVGHLQFVAWERSQAKQAWYRCFEFLGGASASAVNARYWFTRDRSRLSTVATPEVWRDCVAAAAPLVETTRSWHFASVVAWFDEHGPQRFEPLQIWDVAPLSAMFRAALGRPPSPQRDWRVQATVRATIVRDVSRAAERRGRKLMRGAS